MPRLDLAARARLQSGADNAEARKGAAHDLPHRRCAADFAPSRRGRAQRRRRGARDRARGRRGRRFRLFPGNLSRPVAHAGDVRSDRGAGGGGGQARRACGVRHHRADRSQGRATAYNLIVMAYPDGRAPARYRRTHPNGPWIYTGGQSWEFQYVAGDEFPVFDTAHGKVGLAMCSEVYMPEVTRALALRGAELIFMPAGIDKNRLWATWRTLILARAIENLAIVVTTQNLFDHRPARARHGGDAGGDFVREHGGGHEHGRRQPRPRALAARDARRSRLVGGLRRQAGRARPAMAAAGALRRVLSAAAARSG